MLKPFSQDEHSSGNKYADHTRRMHSPFFGRECTSVVALAMVQQLQHQIWLFICVYSEILTKNENRCSMKITRRYASLLLAPGQLGMALAVAFFVVAILALLGHFWCSFVPLVTFSRNPNVYFFNPKNSIKTKNPI